MESLNLTPANPATNPIFTAKFIFVKNKLIILLLLTALCHQVLFAQMPYTQKAYAVYVEKDIPYGTSPTYAGGTEALVLDLYKPIGDNKTPDGRQMNRRVQFIVTEKKPIPVTTIKQGVAPVPTKVE